MYQILKKNTKSTCGDRFWEVELFKRSKFK